MKNYLKRTVLFTLLLLVFMEGCQYIPDIPSVDQSNESPQAYINSITPLEAAIGETVSFSGRGEDSDGTVVAYRWLSDHDGQLSAKADFQINTLSKGTHVITFRVQDNNGGWSQDASQTLVIAAQTVPLPVIELFTASPSTIVAGQSSELRWQVSEADTIGIEPSIGTMAANAVISVSPETTTSYTLTAVNSYGTVHTQVTVTVSGSGSMSGIRETELPTLTDEDGTLVKYSSSYEKRDIPCAGDNDINLPCRAFLSFDINSIPDNAIIQESILDLSDCTVTGEPTYVKGRHGNMGAMEVYYYQYGDFESLDRTAYLKAAQLTAGGSFQDYPLNPWRWDISESNSGERIIQELVGAGASRCQLRVQFFTSTNWDGIADLICFEHAVLTIRYMLP